MRRIVDVAGILLLVGSALAFAFGLLALGDERDLTALYSLAVGGLLLKSSSDLLRPKPDAR